VALAMMSIKPMLLQQLLLLLLMRGARRDDGSSFEQRVISTADRTVLTV